MKKIVSSVLLVAVGVSLYAPIALADGTSSGETETNAEFTTGGPTDPTIPTTPDPDEPDPDPVKPDPKPVPPIDGITLTHMPIISFGTDNQIAVQETNYQAVREKVTVVSNDKTYYSPSYVQVADASGANTKWEVSVKQTKNYTLANSTETLANTRIRIYGNTLTSEDSAPLTDIQGVVKGTEGYANIPTTADNTSLTVIGTKASSQGVTGSIYSSVFADNYKAQDYYTKTGTVTTLGAEQGRYTGVQLNVPKGEKVKKGEYKGTLTWTLKVGP